MKSKRQILLVGVMASSLAITLFPRCATATESSSGSDIFEMTTPIAPSVDVPDKVEISIGTLNLHCGYRDDATTQKICDNLDASRALQAYLLAKSRFQATGWID